MKMKLALMVPFCIGMAMALRWIGAGWIFIALLTTFYVVAVLVATAGEN